MSTVEFKRSGLNSTQSEATPSVEIVFDLEADGWRDEATRVWCICFKRIAPTDSAIAQYGPEDIDRALDWLSQADHLIGHNIINYDLPLLERLYGWKPKPGVKITDTVVLSRVLKSDRTTPPGCPGNVAPHSLAAWGYRVGRGKPDHDDWSQFSPEMLNRCSEDVEINVLTYQQLLRERDSLPIDWSDVLRTEHDISFEITQQERNGVPLDLPLVWSTRFKMLSRIREIDEEVVPLIPERKLPKSQQPTWPSKQFKKDGTPSQAALKYYGDEFAKENRYRTDIIIKTAPINLGSDKQVKEFLLEIGWVPTEWNFKKDQNGKPLRDMQGNKVKTSPKLTLDSLESCQWPESHKDMGEKICERMVLQHRVGLLTGWLRDCRPDGRISAQAIPMGTPTGRMTHRQVVNVPGNGAPHGTTLRSCFTTVEGYDRVGIDLVSCQVYGLAHYMRDEEYRYQVVEGDQHQFAADLAGLASRQDGKKFNYSILFGASDEKLATDLGITKAQAAEARKKYFVALPKLDALMKRLEKEWQQKGYIIGLDGRPIWVRAKHMLLVYLLQTLESVVMKNFILFLIRNTDEYGFPSDAYQLVTTMHDEVQFLVKHQFTELFKTAAQEAIRQVNEKFNLWCPQAIDINVGRTWAECH